MKKNNFISGAINHCYQRTSDHGVLFYDTCDRLMFFTIFCSVAARQNVQVLKLALMPDHTHHSTITSTKQELAAFNRDYESIFAHEYNTRFGRKGPLFEKPFGRAQKCGDKYIRGHLLYLDNNPVERKLVKKAEEYRWNFLAYGISAHPFSEIIILRDASMPLRRALAIVKNAHFQGRYLRYQLLRNLFDSLRDDKEKEQLTDFIISTYSVIDHCAAIRFFGSYENELMAAHSNTGEEWDIHEVKIGKSDTWYDTFTDIIMTEAPLDDIHGILNMSTPQKRRYFELLSAKTNAPWNQIKAFLHLPVELNR